jgi:hypothetical protein
VPPPQRALNGGRVVALASWQALDRRPDEPAEGGVGSRERCEERCLDDGGIR